MRKKSAKLFLVLIIVGVSFSEANSIKFKVDDQGRKVFYNIPSKKLSLSGDSVGIYYSNTVEGFADLIKEICGRHGVDSELVKAVIQVESNFNPHAVSPKGAKGLMQLMPATALRYGVKQIFDPADNVQGGVKYLKDLLGLFQSDLTLSIAAYNAGENAVQRYNGVPAYVETQNYVRKVLALYNGESSYQPFSGGKSRTATYYKYVDLKGVTHYSAQPVSVPNVTKVSFSY